MTDFEEYKEHIRYTHHAYCKIVIGHAAIDAVRRLVSRWKPSIGSANAPVIPVADEISPEYRSAFARGHFFVSQQFDRTSPLLCNRDKRR